MPGSAGGVPTRKQAGEITLGGGRASGGLPRGCGALTKQRPSGTGAVGSGLWLRQRPGQPGASGCRERGAPASWGPAQKARAGGGSGPRVSGNVCIHGKERDGDGGQGVGDVLK